MSPFRSKSQVRKFGAMLKRGEITQATFDKWVKHTPKSLKKLPERVRKKKGKK
jgi:hypothetical protein